MRRHGSITALQLMYWLISHRVPVTPACFIVRGFQAAKLLRGY